MEQEINRIYKNTWITKGTRFIASKRYEKHQNLSNITITIASVYILCLNLLVLLKDKNIIADEIITYSTICLSILVLAFSLIVNAKNYQTLANKFHDCGKEISKIYDIACLYKFNNENIPELQITELQKKYQDIIEKYDINQNLIDYNLFKSRNLNDFFPLEKENENMPEKKKHLKTYIYLTRIIFWLKIQLQYLIHQYLLYSIVIILPPIIIYLFLNIENCA